MKLTDLLETHEGLYMVSKAFGGWSGHPADFQRGDRLRVVSVDDEGMATVTLPDGERIGQKIPMSHLEPAQ